MKILVTGGAGFIGSNFILYWIKNHSQDKIVNLDKLTYAGNLENLKSVEKNPNYKFIHGDIQDPGIVQKALEDVDFVVNFAAESHVDRSIVEPAPFVLTNTLGTQVLLESALKKKVKRFHHVSCYDTKTRAYTKKGLKYYWELDKSDEVLSLNLKTKEIEWKKIAKIIIQDYKGDMINIRSDRVNLLVTPNHRMLFETKKGNLLFKEASKLGARNRLPRGFWKKGKRLDKDFMYLLGFFIGDGFLAYQEKITENISGLTKQEYISLARNGATGRFESIGNIGMESTVISKSYRIFLDVPVNDSARYKVEKTLTNLNINWHAHRGKAGEHIYFNSKELFLILKSCGKHFNNKRIPRWALEGNIDSLQAIFDGLIDSDGYETHNSRGLYTSSKGLTEDFAELCTKLGLTPHVFIRKQRLSYFKGRVIRPTVPSYQITVAKTARSIIPGYNLNHVNTTKYDGKVWCVKIPINKNLLVEREGVFAFCGNTDEVFGALSLESKEKFNEETAYTPRSPYAASKASSDHLVRAYHTTYGLPITISNCSNNYGPYQFPEKLIPLTITNLLEGKKVPVYGDGLYVRDWLYVEDHVKAIELILKNGKIGETYCIGGTTQDINNLEVIKKILKILGKGEDQMEFIKDRLGHDRRYAIDWSKIKKELGWEPKYNFDEWLEKTVGWYRENQTWWEKIKNGEYKDYYEKQYHV